MHLGSWWIHSNSSRHQKLTERETGQDVHPRQDIFWWDVLAKSCSVRGDIIIFTAKGQITTPLCHTAVTRAATWTDKSVLHIGGSLLAWLYQPQQTLQSLAPLCHFSTCVSLKLRASLPQLCLDVDEGGLQMCLMCRCSGYSCARSHRTAHSHHHHRILRMHSYLPEAVLEAQQYKKYDKLLTRWELVASIHACWLLSKCENNWMCCGICMQLFLCVCVCGWTYLYAV